MTPDVSLKPVLDFTPAEWRTLYSFFRDRELAAWNDAKPIRMPEWLFRRVMQEEEKTGERAGFGVMDAAGRLIGNAELYDFRPSPPLTATTATLGIMIGFPALWGQGYGRAGVRALLHWAFAVHNPALQRVRLTTFGHNRRAQRAFAACGFREVGRRTYPERVDVHMEITREEWQSGAGADA
ncbi:GNAT family N-acetyltransferase [Deinococcus radiodurans]|jgi:Acetyltransferases, including N-acetylases of ribosomal proteins|nr:GNAT family protein [Deinococcus radiodurans]ANC71200.1 kanamycin resistance protein [Deinococcus radiodurans R1 = ATCC 13939 = DSM 20539]QIP29674.1 GNAT family N-acetyltransferase [Deinococcus radiodurans]QIP31642.1 GNAT family N-acetyltransferase [Deinococcus radiodurans]UID70674.1 kanamycin resistance protein [Deinococcus radiodurans R1 = ATCC 13939 = DSM 20539]UTA51107.1 GNAT family N-acetyltransferase [Deinococcus radiodurans]